MRDAIRSALGFVQPRGHDFRVKIGMAIHSELPGDDGWELFDAWCQTGDGYDAHEARDSWKSFKSGGAITVGTLFHEAKANGWKGKGAKPTGPAELDRQERERSQKRAAEEAEYRARADEAMRQASILWANASDTGESAYLSRKGVSAHGVRFLTDGTLLVPAVNVAGELVNLQRIAPHPPSEGQYKRGAREKRLLPGGRKSGAFHVIGQLQGAKWLLLCEGYATASSCYEATGRPTVMAFDAGNLPHVARALRERFPGAHLAVCGDDDVQTFAQTGKNPGREKAEQAARQVGGLALFPVGLPADGSGGSDFNDLHQRDGLAAVRAVIEGAIEKALDQGAPSTKGTEPIDLDRKTQAKRRQLAAPGRCEGQHEVTSGSKPTDRFLLTEDGVYYSDQDQDGRGRDLWVCSRLAVSARTRDSDGDAWGYLLEFDDPLGHARSWAMPARMLAGDGSEYRSVLLSLGLRIAAGTKARNLLTLYLQTRQPPEVAVCTDRIGWHGRAFVLPRETLNVPADDEEGPERIVYQTDGPSENPFRVRGTLDGWRMRVGALCIGNSRLTFAASCAFAGPLMRPAGLDSGGFHFRGDSSCGKTTALRVAASVYGGPSFLQRWRQTDNHLEAVAAQSCDTVLILDELAQVDPKTAGECAYLLANETGKGRATRGGQARARLTWRLLFLSAGEIGLAAHMAEGGKRARAGQELRMVDIPAEVTPGSIFEYTHNIEGGALFSMHVTKATEAAYGTAGRAFLAWLVEHADRLRDRSRSGIEELATRWIPEGASGQVHRVARRFALVAAAGELASEAGITGWPTGASIDAARSCFEAWLGTRAGGIGNSETATMRAQVRRFLESHGAGRFTWWHRAADDHAPNTLQRAGLRRLIAANGKPINTDAQHMGEFGEKMSAGDGESTEVEYYVMAECFRAEVCDGSDYRAVCRVLINAGDMIPGPGGRFDHRSRLPGIGMATVYRIRSSIFDAAGD